MTEPTSSKSMTVRAVLAAALCSVLAIAGGTLTWIQYSAANTAPSAPAAALTITVAQASEAEWPAVVQASGAIAPWQEAIIGAQVSGLRLADIKVNVGDPVKRGKVLAVFDAALLRADEARLAADWQQAEANRKRALQLKGSGGISEQDVLQYETQAKVARAQLESTRLQLRYATVTAPDDGVISARSATVGAVSSSGQELFRMIRQNRLEWRGEMSAEQLAHIRVGQTVDLVLPDGTKSSARVRQLAPSLDSQTRLGLVYADLQPGSDARAGMYVRGEVVLAQRPALSVPAQSVVIRDGRSYVLALAAADHVRLQAVGVGRGQGDAVEIVSGLAAGDTVAVQGAGFLNDGDLVRVVAAPTPLAQ